MKFIGITGGVGAGKSEILSYMKQKYQAVVVFSDEVAKQLYEPGQPCYEKLQKLFQGEDVFLTDGEINRKKIAEIVYHDPQKLLKMNAIVHPAVRKKILAIKKQEEQRKTGILILEAALLIEEHYDELCDELWYVYASEETRRQRLKLSRGYSDQKTNSIFKNQLDDKTFRNKCQVIINNDGSFLEAQKEIDFQILRINR